jgi:hypothetical protein
VTPARPRHFVVWRHELRVPIGGGVVSYGVDWRQYVAVAAGMHSPIVWQVESGPAKVVVFGIPHDDVQASR